jgi:serine/threonine protein kinase
MEDLAGKHLGQYRVIAPLGRGGMATVYKAYQPSTERYVALKILPRQYADDPEFMRRFQTEAKVIANLEHPHILPVYDFGEAEGYTFLVMRYVESQSLKTFLECQTFDLSQCAALLSQIAQALDYAHSRGIIHRDVKPSNVLLDENGNCLLSDFGLAKVLISSSQFTTSGAFIGTPTYASPEQCLGRADIDHRSDVYSLGVMLYEMVLGRPPFESDTPMGVVIKHIYDPLPLPRQIKADLPEEVENVIIKALSKEVHSRFQSAGDLARAFSDATKEKNKMVRKPQWRKSRLSVWMWVVVISIIVLISFWGVQRLLFGKSEVQTSWPTAISTDRVYLESTIVTLIEVSSASNQPSALQITQDQAEGELANTGTALAKSVEMFATTQTAIAQVAHSETSTQLPIIVQELNDIRILNVGYLESGMLMVTLTNNNPIEHAYRAEAGGQSFECSVIREYPSRLYCIGTALSSGKYTLSIYLKDSDVHILDIDFYTPIRPEMTNTPIQKEKPSKDTLPTEKPAPTTAVPSVTPYP